MKKKGKGVFFSAEKKNPKKTVIKKKGWGQKIKPKKAPALLFVWIGPSLRRAETKNSPKKNLEVGGGPFFFSPASDFFFFIGPNVKKRVGAFFLFWVFFCLPPPF